MQNFILCPHCQKEFEISEAWKHELEDELLKEERERIVKEFEIKEQEFKKLKEQEINEAKQKAANLAKQESEIKLNSLKEENEMRLKQSETLQTQLKETLVQMRELQIKFEQKEVDMQRKLNEERQKIAEQALLQAQEAFKLKLAEKDQQLESVKRANEDLTRKIEQGSQQTQGEALEIELEMMLKTEFPGDEIREVPKGIRGADVIQVVKDDNGHEVGVIMWESKNTKIFQPAWLAKLRDDQRSAKADIAILVSIVLPENIKYFSFVEGVMVCSYPVMKSVAILVRRQLLAISKIKKSQENRQEKAAVLYQYLTGMEFRHRIEAISDAFGGMQEELQKEKKYFASKWAREEKRQEQVVNHILGMYGDLQGIIGRELPEMKDLRLEE